MRTLDNQFERDLSVGLGSALGDVCENEVAALDPCLRGGL